MFLVGEATANVYNGKLELPKQFHLKHKTVLYKWGDDTTLYISDSEGALNYDVGRDNYIGKMQVDSESRIEVSRTYDHSKAIIVGNISTVKITFHMNHQ